MRPDSAPSSATESEFRERSRLRMRESCPKAAGGRRERRFEDRSRRDTGREQEAREEEPKPWEEERKKGEGN